jgi:aspartate aminotransferase
MKDTSNLRNLLNVVASALSAIEDYRVQIRDIDKRLLSLIQERFSLGDKLAELKEARKLPIIDADAEQAVNDNLTNTAKDLGLPASFARRLGELLIEESVREQEAARPKQSKDLLLKEIFEITQKLLAKGHRVTRFEIGEPNFPASSQVIRGLTETFRKKKVVGYGPAAGLPELRKALAEELSAQHNVRIEPDQILITPGGRFAIFATITSYISPLERVVIPQPAWPAYEECVNFVKGRVIPINTNLEEHWEIDLGKLESEMKKGARMLVLNTPNNPTGKVIRRKKFEEIVELAHRYGTSVLSDEVYDKYVHAEVSSILEAGYDDYVYINSFSKQFSLTGWRIAYLVTTKEKANRIKRVIQTATTCVPEFIQRAALIAIQKGRREAQRNVNDIMKKVELTCRELSKIDVSFYKPDGAFYLFPRANKPNFDSVKFARRLLEQHRVSISPGEAFGDYPAFFRLSVSLPRAQIPSAIKSIGKAIDAW